jgi:hypothetical protein
MGGKMRGVEWTTTFDLEDDMSEMIVARGDHKKEALLIMRLKWLGVYRINIVRAPNCSGD